MQIVKLLSHLLDYPAAHLQDHRASILAVIDESPLSEERRQALRAFVQQQTERDLTDWQCEYDGLFERGRSLSLHLFEHVHGEARDRGQAMVDLLHQYREAGLDIAERELPDYIPLYLEFLCTQGDDNIQAGLAEVAHILATLACRLEQRGSNYQAVLHALLELSQVEVELSSLRDQLGQEKPDYTQEALDKVWEEEMVTFGPGAANDACSTEQSKPSESQRRDQHIPVNWVADATRTQRGA
ncbi:MAG: nitrate reductase molybdenum cofactor assembly chaperone [Saccharospirillum sp.]|nr:nitrate reductase molybdenum cofactor assembly chaperone [Saccharospirillum sp.]